VVPSATAEPLDAGSVDADVHILGGCHCTWEFEQHSAAAEAKAASAIEQPATSTKSPAWGHIHYTVLDVWRMAHSVPVPAIIHHNVASLTAVPHIYKAARHELTVPGGSTVSERLRDVDDDKQLILEFAGAHDAVLPEDAPVPYVLRSVKLAMRTSGLERLMPNLPPRTFIARWRKTHGVKRKAVHEGERGSWEDTFLELPAATRPRVDGSAPAPANPNQRKYDHRFDPIKVIKGLLFGRFLKSSRDFSDALGAARAYENSDYEAEDRPRNLDQGRSTRDRALARLDVVSILLDRREFHADRVHDQILGIDLYTDASPNCGIEFQGMITDIYKKSGEHRRITLPGSSLRYGMTDNVGRGIALVWAIWVLVGPDEADVQ